MDFLGWTIVGLMVAVVMRTLVARPNSQMYSRDDPALLPLIIGVNAMSLLDAASTIYLVSQNHSTEANPVMNALIHRSYLLFFVVKVSLTLIATLTCWYFYGRKRRARSILRLTSHIYYALMVWHCLLLSSVLL